jgi:protein-tyrosine phosphatase
LETQAETHRHIKIDGCYNLRDVGGYATSDGWRTRWRALLRSDSLHRLTPDGWRGLHEHGLRTIVDLRRPAEVARAGYQIADEGGARYQHIPIFDDEAYHTVDAPARDLDDLYRLLLDNCAAQFAAVLRAISAEGAAPALIHCAVGKDRTGLAVALALGVAGVSRTTIAMDYALSYELLAPLYDDWRADVRERGGDLQRLERMIDTRSETMIRTLEYVDARYGGVDGYLGRAGFTASERQTLREALIEPA